MGDLELEERTNLVSAPERLEKFKPLFYKYDEQGIPLHELRTKIVKENEDGDLPPERVTEILQMADKDQNGRLNFKEFVNLLQRQASTGVRGRQLSRTQRLLQAALSAVGDKPRMQINSDDDYLAQYSCCPPPLFLPIITIIELAIFFYYVVDLRKRGIVTTADGGVPFYSPLIWKSTRRYEAWRYFTYMFLHNGYVHLLFNCVFQLLLGLPLELVHHFWRICLLYVLGVAAGSLAHSVFDTVALVGASGGAYALIGAHIANVIMNWEEMNYKWRSGAKRFLLSAPFRLTVLLVLVVADTAFAIYQRYTSDTATKIGIAAHIGGLLSGLLLGIPILRNIDVKPWEKRLRVVAPIVFAAFLLFAVFWNVFWEGYPATDWRKCCP